MRRHTGRLPQGGLPVVQKAGKGRPAEKGAMGVEKMGLCVVGTFFGAGSFWL